MLVKALLAHTARWNDARGAVSAVLADAYAAKRETLQHETLSGAAAVPYVDGDAATFVVSCRAEAGAFDDEVPYAIVLTLEAPVAVDFPIYTQVGERIAVRVPVRPSG